LIVQLNAAALGNGGADNALFDVEDNGNELRAEVEDGGGMVIIHGIMDG
jgi:hypothetical protein